MGSDTDMTSEPNIKWTARAIRDGWRCGVHCKLLVCFAIYCLTFGLTIVPTALFVGSMVGMLVAAGHVAIGLVSFALVVGISRGSRGAYFSVIAFSILMLAFLIYWLHEIYVGLL